MSPAHPRHLLAAYWLLSDCDPLPHAKHGTVCLGHQQSHQPRYASKKDKVHYSLFKLPQTQWYAPKSSHQFYLNSKLRPMNCFLLISYEMKIHWLLMQINYSYTCRAAMPQATHTPAGSMPHLVDTSMASGSLSSSISLSRKRLWKHQHYKLESIFIRLMFHTSKWRCHNDSFIWHLLFYLFSCLFYMHFCLYL